MMEIIAFVALAILLFVGWCINPNFMD